MPEHHVNRRFLSLLRADSRQHVRRILWSESRRSATIGVLKSVEPTGFLAFAPAFAGTNWADVNRRIIQNCPHGRGRVSSSPPVWFRLCRLRVTPSVARHFVKRRSNISVIMVRTRPSNGLPAASRPQFIMRPKPGRLHLAPSLLR